MQTVFHIFPIVALVLYLVSGVLYLKFLLSTRLERTGGGDEVHSSFSSSNARKLLAWGVLLHVVTLLYHELLMVSQYRAGYLIGGTLANFPYTLSLIACLLVGCFLLLERRMNINVLGAFVVPVAVCFMLFSGVLVHFKQSEPEVFQRNSLLTFHIALTVLGHVAFVFAFGVSVALIVQESLLKSKRSIVLQSKLPSLRVLDMLNARFLFGGFLLMFCGILAGAVFGTLNDISFLGYNSRVIWSLVTLVVYALLLTARVLRGLRGRRAAWLSVVGFCCVVASFVGVNVLGGSFHVH